ncbi:MAG: hypothetical protein FJ090_04445 [Deltaproteobacteria bacterium]|nr:hypothetical protein [Deltaproteobacteria bacterium]
MRLVPFLSIVAIGCLPAGSENTVPSRDTTDDAGLADDDGDGLTNAEEDELGTNRDAVDSDGDGYSDFDEVQTEHDPVDSSDMIYNGGWPYNPDKDEMADPGWDGRAKEGSVVPRHVGYDQFGDTFDLYDMAGHGKPVIIDISAEWCSYCQELAKYMGSQESYFDQYERSYPELKVVRKAIENGDLIWVEYLDQNQSGGTITEKDLEQWEKHYAMPNTPVVADEDMLWLDWTKLRGYPALMLVDDAMTIIAYDSSDYFSQLSAAAELVGE